MLCRLMIHMDEDGCNTDTVLEMTMPKAETMPFASDKDAPILLRLGAHWSSHITHVLVTSKDVLGRLKQIKIIQINDRKPVSLTGFSREDLNVAHVYGLKQYHDRRDKVTYPSTQVFSVEAVWKIVKPAIYIFEDMKSLELKKIEKDQHNLISSLGTVQKALDVEVEHTPPLAYSVRIRHSSTRPNAGLVVVYSERREKEYLVMTSPLRTDIPLLPIGQSRTNYQVRAVTLSGGDNSGQITDSCSYQYHPIGISKVITITTCNVKRDLQQLMDKAVTYIKGRSRPSRNYEITKFYRNKPSAYFEDIWANHQGVMKKYLKDNNGDPYSPINGRIDGLFFSASLDTRTKQPPRFSYFGDTRLFIPAEALVSDDCRLYFADFFCHYNVHYATIVITKTGSKEDLFCKDRLIELNKRDNPFFKVTESNPFEHAMKKLSDILELLHTYFPADNTALRSGTISGYTRLSDNSPMTFTLVAADKFHVEFLYTEDVDIHDLMDTWGKDRVCTKHVQGRGVSKKDGIPKSSSCSLCNLDPTSHVCFNDVYI